LSILKENRVELGKVLQQPLNKRGDLTFISEEWLTQLCECRFDGRKYGAKSGAFEVSSPRMLRKESREGGVYERWNGRGIGRGG
jgi:hypothetical protein